MTTIAFDGTTMAADTLATDYWGCKEVTKDKIWVGANVLIGGAGESGQITRWLMTLAHGVTITELKMAGYPSFVKDVNDPHLMVVDRKTRRIYRHAGGTFLLSNYDRFAVGSGRDYALAAMYLGKTAREAVEVAMHFDNGTGGDIVDVRIVR